MKPIEFIHWLWKFCAILFFVLNFTNSFQLKILNKLNKDTKRLLAKSRTKREGNEPFAKDYLIKYGYVPPDSLRSNEHEAAQISWSKAIMEMQSFFGLEETGKLDDETLEVMHKPRCGNLDRVSINANLERKKRYVNVGSKWQSMVVTYSINNYTPKLGKDLTHEAIDDAFAVWSTHVPLDFKKIAPRDNPDIVIFFAELYHNDNTAFDGVGGYLAHAYYPGRGIGGDTHFDGAEPWTLHKKAYQGNDLFLVAVHELGHALGLGHSPNQKAIMAPVYKYHNTKNFQLPQDDIFGIQSVYGKRNAPPEMPIIPTTTTTEKPDEKTTTLFPFRTKIYKGKMIRPTPRSTPPTTTKSPDPDICELPRYDAVSFIRGELYVFSGEYLWRRRPRDFRMQGPHKITSFWSDLTNGVNAVFENPRTNQIVFFKEHMYWEYNGVSLHENSPRTVRFLGLQNDHIGAAVWWERNGKSYFFRGSYYWRFSGTKIERNYPKSIKVWKGIPSSVDAAFSGLDEDGKNHTYFVKGTNYWKFNNWDIKVVSGPKSFREDWLGCGVIERKTAVTPSSKKSNSLIVAIVIALVGASLAIAVIFFLKKTKRLGKRGAQTSVVNSPTAHFNLGYSDMSPAHRRRTPREKLICVTAAQKKVRWFRLSLQEKV